MATWLCRAVHERRGLHADSLLWSRDLLVRGTRGAVDIPRLIEGHVALQAFTVVTKTPRGLNFQRNAGDSDNITMLALVERWPPATWSSLTERALYQASRLRDFESRSQGKFTIVRSAAGLRAYLDRRRTDPAITAGFRMMAPTHLFDNDIGGSSAGVDKGGLTDKGREMVRRMEARHMLVDLAHASSHTIGDVLAIATRPVIVSHTGVKGTCDNSRNLSDAELRGIAHTGGVALGSDFDGAVVVPFDTTGLGVLIDALFQAGFSEDDIAKIMGGNALRVLLASL
jgi:membrane dipeptidase